MKTNNCMAAARAYRVVVKILARNHMLMSSGPGSSKWLLDLNTLLY